MPVKNPSFSTDNSRTLRLSIFYRISYHKNCIPKFLDKVLGTTLKKLLKSCRKLIAYK